MTRRIHYGELPKEPLINSHGGGSLPPGFQAALREKRASGLARFSLRLLVRHPPQRGFHPRNAPLTQIPARRLRRGLGNIIPLLPALSVLGLVLGAPFSLAAMDWPSVNGIMAGNFGKNENGKPLLGAFFETDGGILAADDGELIFSRAGVDHASRLPSPLGFWHALDHGDGIISIYGRFDSNPAKIPMELKKASLIARPGISGWSTKKGFYFSIFDRKERRWVNPSMLISPFPDTRPPNILSVQLRNSEGRFLDPAQVRVLSQGRYAVFVNTLDFLREGDGPHLAPHRIVCSVNGSEIGALNFETYSARDGSLMLYRNGLVPVKQVYAFPPAFEVGEVWFTRGQATLEIITQDIAGNSRNTVYRVQVE